MKILYRLNLVDRIITVSNELQIILEKFFCVKKNKMKTIYNGVEIDKINKLKENKTLEYKNIFNNSNLIKFITVGRLREEKGHKCLIEAFSKVKKEIPNSILIIIGNGPLRSELETFLKRKNLENNVKLLGLQGNPFKYLAKSDIFVLSSKHEGLPRVLLEALVCGIPIISTNCQTGPKEILENGKYGFLANVGDSVDLANKMIYLAKNPTILKAYSKKSTQRGKYFNQEKNTRVWIDLIEFYCLKKDKYQN